LKELLPSQDRVALERWNGKLRRLAGVMQTMGQLVAWAHLRSGGRQGSATADEWIAFGEGVDDWRQPLLGYAQDYAVQVRSDWLTFSAAYRAGVLGL